MDFSQWLKANGYDEAALSESQKKHLMVAWKAETQPQNVSATSSFDETMAAIEAEAQRAKAIQEMTEQAALRNARNPDKVKQLRQLCEAAIADKKKDAKSFQLDLMRVETALAPIVMTPSQPQLTNEVVEAAVCVSGGLTDAEKAYKPEVLEAAHRHFKNGIGLLELIGMVAEQNGFRGNVKRNLREAMRYARMRSDSGEMLALGPSTLDISGILSNVANKFVREAWMFVENVWQRITAIRPVTDFKTITSYSLTGDLTYEQVAPGGELKHGTLGEESYTNKADTYGKILGIDRRDLINDDLGALASAGRRLGRGGALKFNDVFWTEFMADAATFYTVARGNYDDGAGDTLMDDTGLGNANNLFMALNDPDGKPTGTVPKFVLVPPQLYPAAWRLIVAKPNGDTSATVSPWSGMFNLEQSRYLANSSFTGYSTKAWYMLADPNDLPVIESCFLYGQQMPTVETSDLEFERLGIAMRGYHDFGVKKQEYRAAVKMKGEA